MLTYADKCWLVVRGYIPADIRSLLVPVGGRACSSWWGGFFLAHLGVAYFGVFDAWVRTWVCSWWGLQLFALLRVQVFWGMGLVLGSGFCCWLSGVTLWYLSYRLGVTGVSGLVLDAVYVVLLMVGTLLLMAWINFFLQKSYRWNDIDFFQYSLMRAGD